MPELQGVRGTSLLAYGDALENIQPRQLQCLLALDRLGEANNLMVSRESGIPINVVTPRMGELRKKGLIKEIRFGLCRETGRSVIFFVRVRK